MRKTVDKRLGYRGEFDAECGCRCRMYLPDEDEVVLLSDVPDNPGTPLFLAGDLLVTRLWEKLRCPEEFRLLFDDGAGSVDEVS